MPEPLPFKCTYFLSPSSADVLIYFLDFWNKIADASLLQGVSPLLHDAHGPGAAAEGGDQAAQGHQDGAAVGQGLDRRRVRQGDREHGLQLMPQLRPISRSPTDDATRSDPLTTPFLSTVLPSTCD